MKKNRLDVEIVSRGLLPSREKAKALIMAGKVKVNGFRVDKAGTKIEIDDKISIEEKEFPYVSRGGLKLEKAIEIFEVSCQGKVMADIGASTGGFTDCALQNGVEKVFAIDVGYGQLDWGLRNNPKVIVMEKTNARYLEESDLGELVDLVSIDVAFISLSKILPAVDRILKEDGEVLALIKPQFEAGRDKIGKKGVVKEKTTHEEVINRVIDYAEGLNFGVRGLSFSPIKGPEGNIEYLLWLCKNLDSINVDISDIVEKAHISLD